MTGLRKRFAFLAAVILAISAWAELGFSQGVCTSTSTPTQVRAEGTVEVLGSIVLSCAGVSAAPTYITVMVGATLSPASAAPDNMTTFPLPVLTSTAAFGVAPTASVSGNSVTFSFTPAAGPQTFTISKIRANIAASGLPDGSNISAGLSTSALSLTNPFPVVGVIASGLGQGSGFPDHPLNIVACSPAIVTPPGAPASVAGNPDPSATAANSLRVSFVEGFPTAFLTAADEDGGTGGLQGTRFRIQLTGVPGAIIPYAPRAVKVTSAATTGSVSPLGSSLVLQRVGVPNADGSGGAVLAEVPNQFDKVPVSGGIATIVYEVTADSTSTLDTVTLFIALSASGNPGAATINGSFSIAPLGPPTLAPARPQFAPSTEISLSPDKLTFYEFPATTPAPQTFNITNAGSGVLQWNAAITSINGGNWLTLSAANGVGQGSISASVAANSLALGTYNATITITAPGAVNSPLTLPVSLVVTPQPTLEVNPPALSFSGPPGVNPNSQQLVIESLSLSVAWSATVKTSSGGNWLNLSATAGVTGIVLNANVNTAGLAPGSYQGSIAVSAPEAVNGSLIVPVTLTIGGPVVFANEILNGASFSADSLSPGMVASLFGANLGDTAFPSGSSLPITLGGAQVLVNGIPAPLYYTSPGQINFQVPWEVTGSTAQVVVVSKGIQGVAATVKLTTEAPGIFTAVSGGKGQAAVANQDWTVNSADNPARAGSMVELYATGLGSVTPQVPDGQASPGSPLNTTVKTPLVLIGGIPAAVLSSGLATGMVGVYQINALIPPGTQANSAVPVQVQIGASSSNTATIAVH
jgi:uncharacterized protein (TIGR03437 family)